MVAFPASTLTVEVSLTGTLTAQLGDMFASRVSLADYPATAAVDTSTATLEAGEPNPQALLKTTWYEVATAGIEKMRIKVAGTGAKFQVYRQTEVSQLLDEDAAISNIEIVTGASGTDVTFSPEDEWPVYFIQVGHTSGTGTGITLTVEDATPLEGQTFESAIEAYEDAGAEQLDLTNAVQETGEPDPPGIVPVVSGWVMWTAPDPAPDGIIFQVAPGASTTGTVGIAVYTGVAVNSLVSIASDTGTVAEGAAVEFAPTAGTVYWVQITSTDDHALASVSWYVPTDEAELMTPAQVYDYLRVEVYQPDGLTKITEVTRRNGINGQEPLNTAGDGRLSIPFNDPLLKAYPNLLKTGNIVKFFLGPTCISGFRIQKKQTIFVSGGEHAGMSKVVVGPTLQYLLNDFVVHHDVEPRPDSLDVRFYSWASRPSGEAEDWYDPTDWDDPVYSASQLDPPGDWKKPPKKRRKYGMPKRWPDPKSRWLYIKPKDSPRPPRGRKYYRHNVTVNRDGQVVRLFVTADENVTVYMDGEEVINKKARETGYRTYAKRDLVLSRGTHTVAIHVRNKVKTPNGDGNDAMMFTMYTVGRDGKRKDVILRSNGTWKAYYGNNVPGWNRAQVLRNTIKEARERDNESALGLTWAFGGYEDSEGKLWTDRFNQEVKIGTSGLDLQAQLSESGRFDVWVDPDDLKVYAWKHRGKNKSKSVALVPGVNLLDWAADEEDRIANRYLVQFDGGFTEVKAPGSIRKHGTREVYVELGGVKEEDTARELIKNAIRSFSEFSKKGGPPEVILRKDEGHDGSVIGVPGAYPFLDWGVGDTISAPDESGRLVPYRVMALTFTEDSEGRLTFDPELEQVAPAVPVGASTGGLVP